MKFLDVSYGIIGQSNQGFMGISEMDDAAARPEPLQIQEQLDHILRSKTFHLAQRSRAFLRYAVENSLRGNAPKEYAIAVDVLGRDEDYDPTIDATVRVEAGRVRGRPLPRRAIRIWSISGMNFGQSPCWPGLMIRVMGRQRRSATR